MPAELLLLVDRKAAELKGREWAQDIANRFDRPQEKERAEVSTELLINLPPELLTDVVQRNFVDEFQHRMRPFFWISLIVTAAGAALFLEIMNKVLPEPPPWRYAWPLFLLLGVGLYFQWRDGSPLCPNCKRNIRTCGIDHCYRCGLKLRNGRCAPCGANYSWHGSIAASLNPVRRRKVDCHILNCPGCGVELDTQIYRVVCVKFSKMVGVVTASIGFFS